MITNNPYVIYFSGAIVVAIIDAIRIWLWYREDGYLEMGYGRIARNFFAIVFSWLSCLVPIIVCGVVLFMSIVDCDFWKRKVMLFGSNQKGN